MDSGLEGSDGNDSRTLNMRLPVVILPPPPPAAEPLWRIALAHWQLLLVAVLASGVGVLGAALWPYGTTLKDIVATSLPGTKEAAPTGDSADRPALTTTRLNRPAVMIASETCHIRINAPQLIMPRPATTLRIDEPASLGVRVDGAPEGAQLVVCGFAAKSIISAGQSVDEKTWTLPASDVGDAMLIPPAGFAGPMKLDVVLVNLDKTVADRRTLLLQWQPQEPPTSSIPATPVTKGPASDTEIDKQLEEGRRLEAAGNLPLARGIFLRFAQAGYARAAFLLANTYDPISLAKRQLLPPESDPALARIWYRKASDWGSQDAGARLERLANW
jgi:hypothetical protein